ncbi:uncharacterized protein LOC111305619 [Durio zibethinus]|uniref:Uncharacterized protein LOC111305619 n=1 Tax=Durio zibethinus TaxID=66656 RepID=A0A6P6A383_DURZI|nr:uncharacterized protein LOC111305619 [Durio zibethinus]
MKATKSPIRAVATWVRRQPPKMKAFLAVAPGMAALLFLRMVVEDHDNLFIAAEAVHALGTCILIYKLSKEKTCAGTISFQVILEVDPLGFFDFFDHHWELTAIFLAVRLYGSFVMEYDIHTLLDTTTLGTTLWVIYMIRFKLRSSYMEDKDNFGIHYVVSLHIEIMDYDY